MNFSSVQSLSRVWLFATPWTAAHQAYLSITNSWSLPKLMATHSSILAWKIPWTEKPGRLQSIGSQRVRHDWAKSGGRIWSAGCSGHKGLFSDPVAPSRPISVTPGSHRMLSHCPLCVVPHPLHRFSLPHLCPSWPAPPPILFPLCPLLGILPWLLLPPWPQWGAHPTYFQNSQGTVVLKDTGISGYVSALFSCCLDSTHHGAWFVLDLGECMVTPH